MTTCFRRAGLTLALAGWLFTVNAAPQRGDLFPAWDRLRKDAAEARVVLVDFCASWCAPCKASFPELDKLETDYAARGFKVLAVSVDDQAATMRAFLKERPVTFKVLHDTDQSLVAGADIEAMPTSFLLDAQGRILSVHRGFEGAKTVKQLRAEIEKALGPAEAKP